MKFKVGQRFRVRKDLVVNEHYGGCLFVSEMKKNLGKTIIVEKISYENRAEYENWNYTQEMFEQGLKDMVAGDVIVTEDELSKVFYTNKDGFLHRNKNGHYEWDSFKYAQKEGWKIKGQKCETCGK